MINSKIAELRELMKRNNFGAYIVNSADPHLSEYVANRWQSRKFISGFTGSAGTVVITESFAGLWTDGRYYIQAEEQLKHTEIKLFKMYQPGVPTYTDWIFDNMEEESVIGFDGRTLSIDQVNKMKKKWDAKKIILECSIDLIDVIWKDRPPRPRSPLQDHPVEYSGKSRIQKINDIQKKMKNSKADILIITALDEIAWTFNIRGSDVKYYPVSIAFAVISSSRAHLFIDKEKINKELLKKLRKDNISIRRYSEFYDQIKNFPKEYVIQLAPAKTSYKITSSIEDKYEIKKDNHFISGMKAKKNDTEISNLKAILNKDCTVLTRFLIWLKTEINNLTINEFEAAEKLLEFRKENPEFMEASFESISAYGKNAAMMHYSANKTGSTKLKDKGFYLIDSGGHYKSGTTDLTRTIALGQISNEQRRDFTLVLKGVIDLSTARFLKGTTGANLDILARIHLWKEGIDYKCGSGHGVGFFLNVHEGPQNFSQHLINNPFDPGMITTIEPGVYLENRYGIRTENMLLTVEDGTTKHGEWLKFETISFCPIDREAIVVDLLSDEQLEWINNYHQQVYAKISPRLNAEEKKVLKIMTAELVR